MQTPTDYKTAANRRYPEPVAIAVARDERGKCNPITIGWIMLTSHEPPMMAISVGKTRYSLGAIRHAREFVISFPTAAMQADAKFHGTNSGRDMDKLAECATKTQPATKIDCVLLTDAVANFECRLVSEFEAGDHIIMVGEVVASHVNEDASLGRLYTLAHEQLGGLTPDSGSE